MSGFILLLCSIVRLAPHEQVLVKSPDGWWTREGPWQGVIDPGKQQEFREAVFLREDEYALLRNFRTGVRRVRAGPDKIFAEAYEEVVHIKQKLVLQVSEYVRFRHVNTGARYVVDGSLQSIVVPEAYDEVESVQQKEVLSVAEYAILLDTLTGERRIVSGPTQIMPGPHDIILETSKKVELQLDQYLRVLNRLSGRERIVRGPALFVPAAEDTWPAGVEMAVSIDTNSAVLARDKISGSQRLVTSTGTFVPREYEEVLEVRKLIHVGPQEAVLIREPSGSLVVRSGRQGDTQVGSFFLEPYHEQVSLTWSYPLKAGEALERQVVNVIDLTWQRLPFRYTARTSDNVELLLQGSLFWRIQNVHSLLNATDDPARDVWYQTRSSLIQAVGRSTLEDFMQNFNNFHSLPQQQEDNFYRSRGIEVHSIEVSSFDCVDEEVAHVLQDVIRQATNRINRLQVQETENAVQQSQLSSNVQLAQIRKELIDAQAANNRTHALAVGGRRGARVATEASSFMEGLSDVVGDAALQMELYKMNANLRAQRIQTSKLATGKVRLTVVPERGFDLKFDNAAGASPMSTS